MLVSNYGLSQVDEKPIWSNIIDQYTGSEFYNLSESFPDSILHHGMQSLQIAYVDGDSSSIAKLNRLISSGHFRLNQWNEAIEYLDQSIHFYSALKDTIELIESQIEMGEYFLASNDILKADSIIADVKEFHYSRSNFDPLKYMTIIGAIFSKYGYYKKAISFYKEALIFRDLTKGANVNIRLYMHLGNKHFFAGDYDQSIHYFNLMIDEYKTKTTEKEKAIWNSTFLNSASLLLIRFSEIQHDMSYLELAKQYSEQELELTRNSKYDYPWGTLFAQLNFAKILKLSGNIKPAISAYNNSLIDFNDIFKARRVLNDKKIIGIILNDLAELYTIQGEDSLAISYFAEAWRIQSKQNNVAEKVEILNNLGKFHLQKANLDSAKFYLASAEVLLRGRDMRLLEAKNYKSLSEFHRVVGDFVTAKQYQINANELYDHMSENISKAVMSRLLPTYLNNITHLSGQINGKSVESSQLFYIILIPALTTIFLIIVTIFTIRRNDFVVRFFRIKSEKGKDPPDFKTLPILTIVLEYSKDESFFYFEDPDGKEQTEDYHIKDVDLSLLLFLALEKKYKKNDSEYCWLDHQTDAMDSILDALNYVDKSLELQNNFRLDIDQYELIAYNPGKRKKLKNTSWIWDFENDLRRRRVAEINKLVKNIQNGAWHFIDHLPNSSNRRGRYHLNKSITQITIQNNKP